MNWVPKRKVNAVDAYTVFLRFHGKIWDPPHYRVPQNYPFVSTKKEIDALIARTGPRTSTLLLFLKETGVRIGEATRMKWIDIDYERKLVNISPEKGSNPWMIPVSDILLTRLQTLKCCSPLKDTSKVFQTKQASICRLLNIQRKRIAQKLRTQE
jgi:integrase